MSETLAWLVGGASVTLALWAGVRTVLGRRFDDPLFYAASVLEVLVVVQLVVGVVALSGTDRDVDAVTFVSYLATAVLLPPVAVVWAASDPTRWGTAVVSGLGLVEAVLSVRLLDIWTAGGG